MSDDPSSSTTSAPATTSQPSAQDVINDLEKEFVEKFRIMTDAKDALLKSQDSLIKAQEASLKAMQNLFGAKEKYLVQIIQQQTKSARPDNL